MRLNDDVSRMSRNRLEHEVRRLRADLRILQVQNTEEEQTAIAPYDGLITREQHEAELKEQKDIDAKVNCALNHLNNVWAVIQTLVFLDNGPNLRNVLGNSNTRILSALDHLDNTLQQIDSTPGLRVNFAKFQRTFDGSRELWNAVKVFLAVKDDTDQRYRELQEFVRQFNPRILEVVGDSITINRGKRRQDSEISKLLKRVDSKIYEMYSPGKGYEQIALSAANVFRSKGDKSASDYIDSRKDKRQFARDAIEREEKRRKLVCVE